MALCSLILFAGHETTTNLLCNALVALDRHPAELARLRDDPSLVNRAVEEVLRFEGPIKIIIRWVVEDHDRDGKPVRAGDRVFLVLQSANRDGGTFADPDRSTSAAPPSRCTSASAAGSTPAWARSSPGSRPGSPCRRSSAGGDLRVLGEVAWRPNIASRAVTGLRVGYG